MNMYSAALATRLRAVRAVFIFYFFLKKIPATRSTAVGQPAAASSATQITQYVISIIV